MRSIAIALAFLVVNSFALADSASTIDLDRPGVLDQLKQQHPQRYHAVNALLRASAQMPCQDRELELLEARFEARDVECGMMVITSYPARRRVSFELDGTRYAANVALEDTDTPTPISSVTVAPLIH